VITHPEHQKAGCAIIHNHVPVCCMHVRCGFSLKRKYMYIILTSTAYLTDNYVAVNTESLVLIIVLCEQLK
jgi:hypothetical protein